MNEIDRKPRRPFVRNQLLPRWLHRFFNALLPSLLATTVLLLLLPNLWIGLGAGAAVYIVLIFINPDRLSFVEGVAGGDGYCDMEESYEPRP